MAWFNAWIKHTEYVIKYNINSQAGATQLRKLFSYSRQKNPESVVKTIICPYCKFSFQ